jgi:4-hydroxybenzoate polyprenyltransferase
MSSIAKKTGVALEMIKWEHSVFALPFALTAAVLAADGWPRISVLCWIVVCMVSARTAAMAFNRLADAELDAANPRTAMRALPAGELSKGFVTGFVAISAAVFFLGAAMLNRLTLELAPVALVVVLAYSYMKRVTRWSHLVLGLALGIAPSAAWIAVRGSLDPRIVVLTVAVLLWVGGFDVLYACQDFEHDRRVGLNSVPQAFGVEMAFWIARVMHVAMIGLLLWMAELFGMGKIALVGVGVVTGLLMYEHSIIRPNDLRRMNAAFFTLNGIISVVFFVFVAADTLIRR